MNLEEDRNSPTPKDEPNLALGEREHEDQASGSWKRISIFRILEIINYAGACLLEEPVKGRCTFFAFPMTVPREHRCSTQCKH